MKWLQTFITLASASFSDIFFSKRSASTTKKVLTQASRPNSGSLFSLFIHGTWSLISGTILKARDIIKGTWNEAKRHESVDPKIKQEAETTYKESQAEQEGIVNKTTASFKDRLESAKIDTLKYIDHAFRPRGRSKIKFDTSKSLMQNIGRFRPKPMSSVSIQRVRLDTGKAAADLISTRLPAAHTGNIQDETGRAIANSVVASMADHFESTKNMQTKAARAVAEVAAESNKNITDNLDRVVSATVASNKNLNQNLAEMHNSLEETVSAAIGSLGESSASNSEKLKDSVSTQISESDEAASNAFKALSEQLYNNEISFAESHKEEMTLLARTKTGLNQLIDEITTHRNSLIAAGASMQSLEGKVAEIQNMPVIWGEKFKNLSESITKFLGLFIGRAIGSAYMGGVVGIAGVKTLMDRLSSVHFLNMYPFKDFSAYGNSLANTALKSLNSLSRTLGIDGLEQMLPKEILDCLQPSGFSAPIRKSSDKDIQRGFKEEKSPVDEKTALFAKQQENLYKEQKDKLNKLRSTGNRREQAFAEGIKTLAFDNPWMNSLQNSLLSASKKDIETTKSDLTAAISNSLPPIYREREDGTKTDVTKDILFHGIDSRYDLFSSYMNGALIKSLTPEDKKVFESLTDVFGDLFALNPAAVADQLSYFMFAIRDLLQICRDFIFDPIDPNDADYEEKIGMRVKTLKTALLGIYSGKLGRQPKNALYNSDQGARFRNSLIDFLGYGQTGFLYELATNPSGVVNVLDTFVREYANMTPDNPRFMNFLKQEYKRRVKDSSIMRKVSLSVDKNELSSSMNLGEIPEGLDDTDAAMFNKAIDDTNSSKLKTLKTYATGSSMKMIKNISLAALTVGSPMKMIKNISLAAVTGEDPLRNHNTEELVDMSGAGIKASRQEAGAAAAKLEEKRPITFIVTSDGNVNKTPKITSMPLYNPTSVVPQ